MNNALKLVIALSIACGIVGLALRNADETPASPASPDSSGVMDRSALAAGSAITPLRVEASDENTGPFLHVVDSSGDPVQSAFAFQAGNPRDRFFALPGRELSKCDESGRLSLGKGDSEVQLSRLIVTAPGYRSAVAADRAVARDGNGWELALVRGASVELSLRDLAAKPVSEVVVSVTSASLPDGVLSGLNPPYLAGVGDDALYLGVTNENGVVRFDGLREGVDCYFGIAGSGLVLFPGSPTSMVPDLGHVQRVALEVAPVVCCAFIATPDIPLELSASGPLLGNASAFASALMRTKMDLRKRFPKASVLVGVGRDGVIAEGGILCDVVCRAQGVDVWRGSSRMVSPASLREPVAIRFSPPTQRDGQVLITARDQSGAELNGLYAVLMNKAKEGPSGRRVVKTGQYSQVPAGDYTIQRIKPAFATVAGRSLGGVQVGPGGRVEAIIELAGSHRELDIEVRLPDGKNPTYAIVGVEAGGGLGPCARCAPRIFHYGCLWERLG